MPNVLQNPFLALGVALLVISAVMAFCWPTGRSAAEHLKWPTRLNIMAIVLVLLSMVVELK